MPWHLLLCHVIKLNFLFCIFIYCWDQTTCLLNQCAMFTQTALLLSDSSSRLVR